MAQQVKPNLLRLGLINNWSSRWFFKKNLRSFIEEDHLIRKIIRKKILAAGIAAIEIERINQNIRILIRASRPGLIIGRGGRGVEDLRNMLLKAIIKLREEKKIPKDLTLNINIEELKRNEASAAVIAQQIAFDLEKRQPYRRVIKRYLDSLVQNYKVKGAKIKVSGRLNGAEIARRAWLVAGRMPLQTLRADIDYGEATSFNNYGTVGVKVWIFRGEVFDNGSSAINYQL